MNNAKLHKTKVEEGAQVATGKGMTTKITNDNDHARHRRTHKKRLCTPLHTTNPKDNTTNICVYD